MLLGGLLINLLLLSFGFSGSPMTDELRVKFTDITAASGIAFKHLSSPEKKYIVESMSGGVALLDFDRDGWQDIYFVNSPTVATAADPASALSELWRNNGDGTFTNVTARAGVGQVGWGMGVCIGDYDNDGWEDLYVTCWGNNHLFRNKGDGTFADVTSRAGVNDSRWSTGAAFADYDNDGWLDLFVANYIDLSLDKLPEFGKGRNCQYQGVAVQCGPQGLKGAGDALFHNNGDGTFTEVSGKAGVSDPQRLFGLGVAWCDFNDDGRADLYVANDTGANYLYQNQGQGIFAEVGLLSGASMSEDGKAQASMGVTIGDVRHRGRWDIFVTNFSDEYNAFYQHEKDFQFTDVSWASQTARASLPFVGWGAKFFDYDNDGWLDLMVMNGHVYPQVEQARSKANYRQRKLLYRNNRNGTFLEIGATFGSAITEPASGRGAAFGDLDNDGDVDVIINNLDGAPAVLRNDGGSQNHFLIIELVGSKSNRSAFGARVKVKAGDLLQMEERRSGGSYISQNDVRLHFGLEKKEKVESVDVRWPSGETESFTDIPLNSFIRITEGEGKWQKIKGR